MSRRRLAGRPSRTVPRRRTRGRIASAIAATLAALLVAVFAIAPGGDTYAAFSDFGNVDGNSASADVWQANPPAGSAGCGDLSQYTGVVYASSLVGLGLEAAAHTILVVDRAGVTVTADAGACVVVSVLGVTILNVDATVHVILNAGIGDTVCQVTSFVAGLLALLLPLHKGLCPTVLRLIAGLGAILNLGLVRTGQGTQAILPGLTDPTTPTTKDAPIIGRTDPTTSVQKTTPAADPPPKDSKPTQGADPTHPSGTTAAPPPAKPTDTPSPATQSPSDTGAATQGDALPTTDPTSPAGGQ